jgi:hypothetical protein
MNSSKLSRLVTLILIVLVTSTFFSCNRGYGCPSNFSLDAIIDSALSFLSIWV